MKILTRHKIADDIRITESSDGGDPEYRKFTATIMGWQGWKLYIGTDWDFKKIIEKAFIIRGRIESGDDKVFNGQKKDKNETSSAQ